MNKKQLKEILLDKRIPDHAEIAMECFEEGLINYVALLKYSEVNQELIFSDDWETIVDIKVNQDYDNPANKSNLIFIKDKNNNEINFLEKEKEYNKNYGKTYSRV